MAQELVVLQSLWAMERRHTDGFEPSLESNLDRIFEGNFAGTSAQWDDHAYVSHLSQLLTDRNLIAEGIVFPKSVEELKPILDLATRFPVCHLNVQPDIRPRRIEECLPFLEGCLRLAEEVDFPIYFETHRDRMTTDLLFTLDLMDAIPGMPLLADLSHLLVGREFPYPVSEENHRLIYRILENSWALHGRVASREQVQIEISFPHHQIWVDLFAHWWDHGMRSWRKRAHSDAKLVFTCELGPKPYSITGRDGNDSTDRWAESLLLKDLATRLWVATA